MELLELHNLTKRYPGVTALDKVSIAFRQGEVHALVGENGAGKSTFIKTISGAAIEEPIFNLVEKLITNEYFLNLVSDPEEVAELRKLAANKVSLIKTMTVQCCLCH